MLLLDDGLMAMRVDSHRRRRRSTPRCCTDGALSDRKGLNRLGGGLSLGALTDQDKEHIGIAAELGVDFLAVSFCRSAADMNEARALARAAGSDAALVAKIERAEAIENLVEIIDRLRRGDGRARRPGRGDRRRRAARACRRRSSAPRSSTTAW